MKELPHGVWLAHWFLTHFGDRLKSNDSLVLEKT